MISRKKSLGGEGRAGQSPGGDYRVLWGEWPWGCGSRMDSPAQGQGGAQPEEQEAEYPGQSIGPRQLPGL